MNVAPMVVMKKLRPLTPFTVMMMVRSNHRLYGAEMEGDNVSKAHAQCLPTHIFCLPKTVFFSDCHFNVPLGHSPR